MVRQFFITISCVVLFTLALPHTWAQDNLLVNGGLEQGEFGPYQGRGRPDLNVPAGWQLWLGQGEISENNFYNRGDKVYSFPHGGPGPAPVEGGTALNVNGGFVQFSIGYFQSVSVEPGANLRAEATSQIKACNTEDGREGFCGSKPDTNARTRIGIDPDGGTDPNAGDIVWSAWLTPHDRWDTQAVEATATGGAVTVFIFATQDQPSTNNQVYWDDVKLFAGGGGGAAPAGEGDSSGAPEPAPIPNFVPFVNPQGTRDDGAIIHTVQSGDTLNSIAVAYGVSSTEIIDRNPNLTSTRFLRIGQEITIQPPPEPTPVPTTAPNSTAVPGGLVAEEVAALPPAQAASDQPSDVVIVEDPKAQATADDTDTQAALDMVDIIFGSDDLNPVPSENDPAPAEDDDPTEDDTAPQATPTEAPTDDDSAEEMPPTAAPTESDEADTIADAAPVVQPETAAGVDVASSTVAVCVSMFEDNNANRLREDGEPLLAGGSIVLTRDDQPAADYQTDGTSEPHCITDLDVGVYEATVTAPAGYGLTTPARLQLPLVAGSALNIEIGAAEGLTVAEAAPSSANTTADNSADERPAISANSPLDNLLAVSGIIVAALAGVVVLAGVGAAILIRRAS